MLYNLKVTGVSEVVGKYSSEAGVARKGVRAHFHLGDSGLVNVTSVEAAFERTVSVQEQGGGRGSTAALKVSLSVHVWPFYRVAVQNVAQESRLHWPVIFYFLCDIVSPSGTRTHNSMWQC